MPEYDNNNKGALFTESRGGKRDLSGSIVVDGIDYWISGWNKEPKSGGDSFISLSVQKKEKQTYEAPEGGSDEGKKEIPF